LRDEGAAPFSLALRDRLQFAHGRPFLRALVILAGFAATKAVRTGLAEMTAG
jgi:hypothetical protein